MTVCFLCPDSQYPGCGAESPQAAGQSCRAQVEGRYAESYERARGGYLEVAKVSESVAVTAPAGVHMFPPFFF